MPQEQFNTVQFCLEVDFDKNVDRPERVFDGIACMIRSLHDLDQTLISCVDGEIKPVLMLESVEAGSIRVWLAQKIAKIPDSALKDGEAKKIIGHFLVEAKYAAIQFLGDKTTIADRNEVKQLQEKIFTIAKETRVNQLDCYHPPKIEGLLTGLQQISDVIKDMSSTDKMAFVDNSGNSLVINGAFDISPDRLEEMVTSKILYSTSEMILKVKQPDYLGEAQWKLKHGQRTIEAKILDDEWLQKFQSRQVTIQPGDSIRATVHSAIAYGYNNEPIREKYEVTKVFAVLPSGDNGMTVLPPFER